MIFFSSDNLTQISPGGRDERTVTLESFALLGVRRICLTPALLSSQKMGKIHALTLRQHLLNSVFFLKSTEAQEALEKFVVLLEEAECVFYPLVSDVFDCF